LEQKEQTVPKCLIMEQVNNVLMTSAVKSVKVGTSRIPSMRFDVLLKDLTLIFSRYGDNGFSKEEMKDCLASIDNNVVYKKVKELKLFGLVEGGLGRYNITDLGRKIVQFDNLEREKDIENAMRLIPIWNLFLENGGKNITDEKIIEILIKDVGLDAEEAKGRSRDLTRAFKRDVLCIRQFNPRFIVAAPYKIENLSPRSSDITPSAPQSPKIDTISTSQALRQSEPEEKITISKDYGEFHIQITTIESSTGIAIELVKEMRKFLKEQGVSVETNT
jgi:hypothetical protein